MRTPLVLLGVGLVSCQGASNPERDLESVKEWVRSEFPEAPQVSPEELREKLDAPEEERPVLLDVREEREYAVSHLPGAVRIDPGAASAEVLESLDRSTPIVAYCSVGYRSSQLVERLKAQGFTDVTNLEGSIFEWANRGYPVERCGEPVREVHPYDEEWGALLDPSLRAYEPGATAGR